MEAEAEAIGVEAEAEGLKNNRLHIPGFCKEIVECSITCNWNQLEEILFTGKYCERIK